MKNEINNTSKSVLQPDEQSSDDKSSLSTAQDNTALMRRRSLLKGLGAAPLVVTLHSGAAMAASSVGGCVGHPTPPNTETAGCRAGTAGDHDDLLRVVVDEDGMADDYYFSETSDGSHPYFDSENSEKNLCLVSIDTSGNTYVTNKSEVELGSLTTNSCWASFM